MIKPIILSLCDYSGAWSRPFIEAGYIVIRVDPKHDPDANQGGTGYTAGAGGSGRTVNMPDGGLGLALTAGSLAAMLAMHGRSVLRDVARQGLRQSDGYLSDVRVAGVMIAAPCTDFASSGARWFKAKDQDGRTAASVSIVRDCIKVVDLTDPDWWVLENPVGRIARCVPELGEPLLRFNPCDYAGFADEPDHEAYTKRTALYGSFNPNLPTCPREPVYYTKGGKRGSWQWATLGGKSERTKELRSMTPQGFSRAFAAAQLLRYPAHREVA